MRLSEPRTYQEWVQRVSKFSSPPTLACPLEALPVHALNDPRLFARIYQQTSEAIVITDAHNHIVAVNPAFTRLTGYTADEAVGRDPKLLASGRTTPAEYQALWGSLVKDGYWEGEIWDRRKDGTLYPKWMVISVLRDEAGDLLNYIATFHDIG